MSPSDSLHGRLFDNLLVFSFYCSKARPTRLKTRLRNYPRWGLLRCRSSSHVRALLIVMSCLWAKRWVIYQIRNLQKILVRTRQLKWYHLCVRNLLFLEKILYEVQGVNYRSGRGVPESEGFVSWDRAELVWI